MHYINYILVAAKLQSLEQLETLLFYNGYLLKKIIWLHIKEN